MLFRTIRNLEQSSVDSKYIFELFFSDKSFGTFGIRCQPSGEVDRDGQVVALAQLLGQEDDEELLLVVVPEAVDVQLLLVAAVNFYLPFKQ